MPNAPASKRNSNPYPTKDFGTRYGGNRDKYARAEAEKRQRMLEEEGIRRQRKPNRVAGYRAAIARNRRGAGSTLTGPSGKIYTYTED